MKSAGLVLLALNLALAGCASRAKPEASATAPGVARVSVDPGVRVIKSLAGTRWIVVQLDGLAAAPAAPDWPAQSLEFDPAGTGASGHAGVNRFASRYFQEGRELGFGPLALTRRIGPPEQMEIERRYTQMLSRVVAWRQDGIHVVLIGPGERRLALLAPVSKQAESGVSP